MKKCFLFILFCFFYFLNVFGQTAFVGDKFGGRLWYHPTNYSVGSYSAHTVCGDSSQLYSWGSNAHGELGYTSWNNRSLPIAVTGMTNVHYYSAGYVAGAIKKDKSGWIWGKRIKKPTKVIENAIYVDAGENAVCFIKKDGTVWSIGENYTGSFGNGNYTGVHDKIQKMIGVEDAVRVANGKHVTLVLLSTGEVMACGSNVSRGLGNDSVSLALEPKKISGLENIVAIAASRRVNLALDKNGDVFIWGRGFGNRANTLRKLPELSNIVAISARNDGAHLMALDSEGNCYSWGHNFYKQLGTKDKEDRQVPTLVATNVIDILAGESFSYIVKEDWSLWCAGSDNGGSVFLEPNKTSSDRFVEIELNREGFEICNPGYALFSDLVDICQGDTFCLGLKKYTSAGTFIDTISNSRGLDSIIRTSITVLPQSYTNLTVHLCPGLIHKVDSNSYMTEGWYVDTFMNRYGCDSFVFTTVSMEKEYLFDEDYRVCPGDTFIYESNPHFPEKSYVYHYKTIWGCDSTHMFYVDTILDKSCYPGLSYIPNSFTPNGDLLNDDFGFVGVNISSARLRIYNTWGEKIFDEIGKNPRWNGVSLVNNESYKSGVYSYYLETRSLENVKKVYSGVVSLVK